jgi:hypothetical protein
MPAAELPGSAIKQGSLGEGVGTSNGRFHPLPLRQIKTDRRRAIKESEPAMVSTLTAGVFLGRDYGGNGRFSRAIFLDAQAAPLLN